MKCAKKFAALCVFLLSLLAVRSAFAQDTTGSIAGTVFDANGAAVANATVTATNTEKNAVIRIVKTDDRGGYVLSLLPVGHYSVSAEANGFKKAERAGMMVNVHDQLTANFNLEVGTLNETVTVNAGALHVETQTATQGGLVNPTEMHELPLNTRNFVQFVTLMPGVSTSSGVDTFYIGNSLPSGTTATIPFYFDGNRNSTSYWTLDGADNIDRGSDLTLLDYPSVDAIDEFKVLRGQYDPEFGRSAGAQITVVTKSGSSQYHGDAYEFFRNNDLQANNFFNNKTGTARPPLRYNDFGYTFGGPLFIPRIYPKSRSKTYFFFSQELRRVITYGSVTALVPTAALKSGQFTGNVCTAYNASGVCTTFGNSITTIDPVAAAYIKDIWNGISTPNSSGINLVSALRNVFNADQQLLRIDHIFSPKFAIFGRFIHDAVPTVEPGGLFTGDALPNVATTDTNSPGWNVVLHAVTTMSSTLLNEAGFQFSYGAIISNPVGLDNSSASPDVHPTLPYPSTLGRIPALSISGISSITGYGPYRDYNRNYNLFDNQTWIHGQHTVKMGITVNHYEKDENTAGNNVGAFGITTAGQTGAGITDTNSYELAWANFLLGHVATFSQASKDVTADILTNQLELYVQDQYRIRPNLTITYGARYSMFRQPTDGNNQLTNFDPALYNPLLAPTIDSNGLICTTSPCAGGGTPNPNYNPFNGIIINNLTAGPGSPYGSKVAGEDYKDIAPRLGFAWDPWNDGKTSIRGGYGMFYDSALFGIEEQSIFANPPFVQSANLVNTSLGNPAGGTPNISLVPTSLHATMLPNHSPYVQEISLDVQHEFRGGILVDIGYVANKGTHLLGEEDLNMPLPGAYVAAGLSTVIASNGTITVGSGGVQNENLLNQIRPYKGYGPITAIEDRFNSNYNGLQFEAQKRFTQHALIKMDYTYSKALTDNQTDRSTAPQNLYNIAGEYGPLQGDRTHIFSLDYVYELPWFQDQKGVAGRVLGGWQLSGIVSAATGLPLTVTSLQSFDPAGQGVKLSSSPASYRPDEIADPNANAPHTLTQWFNTAAFANVPAGQTRPGTERRGAVRGPGYQIWNFSLAKNIRVTETTGFEFRAEAYNAFNHTNPFSVDTALGDSTFGQVTSTRDPRVLQLGLKFNF